MTAKAAFSIIIPMHNEEPVIEETYRRLKKVMGIADLSYELIFVNDGSTDRSAEIIMDYGYWDDTVKLVELSRNFGHQIAITAGMDYAQGNAVIIIDADLQDPPELILEMIAKWQEGFEVVYAKRVKRSGETWFKKGSASLFYRILRASTDISMVDTGDFRLMDRKVVNELRKLPENNRFVHGLVSWVGFRQYAIEYEREERFAGETQYPLKRMLKLSMDGIASFSYKLLKLSGYAGMLLSGLGFVFLLYVLFLAIFTTETIKGWASLISIMLLFNGFVLLMLGVLGEYVGRIYDETKGRPLYIVSNTLGMDPHDLSHRPAVSQAVGYESRR
ncbi:dolichol-phosphate mannosyltransferase [Paenibacillus phyllosphaerae]|uniref:Dolichol-phosphate mannosyltransferase n=1 Tax=Paenibacillus phyllosphaerae TaxID=274593 RepID=A0A7W5AW00_9BACL|nr:glycosyltransferase family 2 protein [Paenibacillus phyllosphaerae]MBB3109805.1 dolichol-phosphate mannosyltransferase [Paenibacillus phyllosphaerae]